MRRTSHSGNPICARARALMSLIATTSEDKEEGEEEEKEPLGQRKRLVNEERNVKVVWSRWFVRQESQVERNVCEAMFPHLH